MQNNIIAIGNRGTAFTTLTDEQAKNVKLNARNEFVRVKRNKAQKTLREQGVNQGVLFYDACAWLESRETEKGVYLATVSDALKRKLIRKVTVECDNGKKHEKFVGYVRADFNGAESLGKAHRVIAVESELGRIETRTVKRENGKGARNARFIRDNIRLLGLDTGKGKTKKAAEVTTEAAEATK